MTHPAYLAANTCPAEKRSLLRRRIGNRKMVAKPARRSVAIVVPPNAQSLDVSGPLDAFLEANRHSSGRVHYNVRLIAIDAGKTIRAGGMSLIPDTSIFDDDQAIDTLLVAGTPDFAVAYFSEDFHN